MSKQCHGPNGPRAVDADLIPYCKQTKDGLWTYRCSVRCSYICDGIENCRGEIFRNAPAPPAGSTGIYPTLPVVSPTSVTPPIPSNRDKLPSVIAPSTTSAPVTSATTTSAPEVSVLPPVSSTINSATTSSAVPTVSEPETVVVQQDADDELLTAQIEKGNLLIT